MVRLLADRLGRSVSLEERNLLDAVQSGAMDPGLAPLHMAAKNGHANVMDVLLQYGSNPRVRTVRDGPLFAATALHLAAQYGHIVSMPSTKQCSVQLGACVHGSRGQRRPYRCGSTYRRLVSETESGKN